MVCLDLSRPVKNVASNDLKSDSSTFQICHFCDLCNFVHPFANGHLGEIPKQVDNHQHQVTFKQ